MVHGTRRSYQQRKISPRETGNFIGISFFRASSAPHKNYKCDVYAIRLYIFPWLKLKMLRRIYVGVLIMCVGRTNFDVITRQTVKVHRERVFTGSGKFVK